MKYAIVKDSRAIILPESAGFVRDHIPKTKPLVVGGKNLIAVKDTLDNVLILNSLGWSIESPILRYYEWPKIKNRYSPYDHQKDTSRFFTMHKRNICLNQMGTGKTASTLWSIDYLKREGYVNKVLIVAPLSTLQKVWNDAIFETYHWLSANIVHGTAAKRKELLAQDVDIYVINHDGIATMYDDLQARKDIDLIVFDEASVLRNHDTNIYKYMKGGKIGERKVEGLATPVRRLWLLTGTPTPNAPTDCWALGALVNPNNTPKYFGSFKRETMIQITQFKWVPKKDAHLRVHEILQPAICYRKEDCLTLPPITFQDRECELSPEQKKMFKEMRKEMIAEWKAGTVEAVNAADKILKLRQILCGSIKTGEGEYQDIESPSRLKVMLECIEESNSKTIIFVPFVGALAKIKKYLIQHKISVESVSGEVSQNKRNEIFTNFQDSKNPRVLLAHPEVASHGLNLTSASTIIWFAPITSCDQYLQANERIPRPGQQHHMTIVHIGGSSLEWDMYNALRDRKDLQNSALDLYKKIVTSD